MKGDGFVKVSGYGLAFEEAAKNLGVFSVRELRGAVRCIRPPGIGSAQKWVRVQVEAGVLVKVGGGSNVKNDKLQEEIYVKNEKQQEED